MQLPPLRMHNGYWLATVRLEGNRRTVWSLGPVATTSEEAAKMTLARRLNSPHPTKSLNSVSLIELVKSYLRSAEKSYVRADGMPTGEAQNILYATQPFIDLFGKLKAAEIRPRHFKAFIVSQGAADVSRQTINKRIGHLKRLLRWGKNEELIDGTAYEACRDFEPVKAGRGVREAKSIRAVPMAQVEQTLEFMPDTLKTMIRLQIVTAMRPEEVCAMRPADLDMTKSPWLYVPLWHKNSHRGQERRIYLGPRAQALLRPYLKPGGMEVSLFSPASAIRERRGRVPKRRINPAYNTRSYRKSIWYACDRAFPLPDSLNRRKVPGKRWKAGRLESVKAWRLRLGEDWAKVEAWRHEHRWSPNRLRKMGLSNVERSQGKQAARAYAGHTRVETTQDHYLEQDTSLARSVAEQVG